MNKRIISLLLVFVLIFSVFSIIEISNIFAEAENNNLITGGGFETAALWDDSKGRTKKTDAFEGEYVVVSSENKTTRKLSNEFKLLKNTSYKVEFWYRNPVLDETGKSSDPIADMFAVMKGSAIFERAEIKAVSDWTYSYFYFNSGDTDTFKFGIRGFGMDIDAITVSTSKIGNIVDNPSFESGLDNWNSISLLTPANISTKNSKTGYVFADLSSGDNSGIYTDISVNKKTKYNFSFDYKGGGTNAWYGIITNDSSFESPSMISEKETFISTNSWKNEKITFSTGSNDTVRIVFFLGNNGTLCIDDVKIYVDDSNNLISNPSFESGIDSGWGYNQKAPTISSISNSGTNSLNLPQKLYGKIYKKITVNKNKKYVISFSHKYGNGSQWSVCDGEKTPVVNNNEDGYINGGKISDEGKWEQVSKTFNSGDCSSVWIAFQSSSDVNSTLIDDLYLAESFDDAPQLLLENGDFENGFDGWETLWGYSTYFSLSDEAKSGKSSLHILPHQSYPKIGHPFKVKEGKTYVLLFNYKGNCQWSDWAVSCGGDTKEKRLAVATDAPTFITGGKLTENTNDWLTMRSEPFTATEDGMYYANFQTNGNSALSVYIDNVIVLECADDSLILNGSFSGTMAPWDYDNEKSNIILKDNSVLLRDGQHEKLSQRINVDINTKYLLSFTYKGKVPKDISAVAVSPSVSFNDNCRLKKILMNTDTEKTVEFAFDSGDNTSLYLIFQTMPGSEYYISNVKVSRYSGSLPIANSVKNAYFLGNFGKGSTNNYPYITDASHNLIKNSSFESDTDISSGSAANMLSENATIDNSTPAFDGEKSLKFVAGSDETSTDFKLPVQKKKTYWMTLFVKATQYSGNSSFISFGVSEPDNGDFLIFENPNTESNRPYTVSTQMVPASFDGEWHLTTFKFETNDVDNLFFKIRGTNATVYIDKMYLFEDGYGYQYKSPIEKLSNVTITNEKPKNLDVNSQNNNLFDNYDLDSLSEFWSNESGFVYGDSLSAIDSRHSIQGNALYYSPSKKSPYKCYYIKWIDVKPNTEYTFSAKYCIEKKGNGYIGLLSGYKSDINSESENAIHPSLIKKFAYGKDEFDENCNWQNIAVSFNSNDRNRIGLAIFDGGGKAYFDDLRLFETVNGKKLVEKQDNFPKNLVFNNKDYNISGGCINGINSGTKLSAVINLLKNSRYIRAFDTEGNEITDFTKNSATGIELRLMDGPTIKDRATIIVKGDVNGDGLVDDDDIVAVVRSLSKEKILKGIYETAADYDVNGIVNIYDVMHKSEKYKVSGIKPIIKGPKELSIGGKMTINLSLNGTNNYACNGILNFDSKMLEFGELQPLDKNTVLSYTLSDSQIIFAAYNKNGFDKNVLKATFTVGEITKYSDAAVSISDFFATDGKCLFEGEDYIFVPGRNNSAAKKSDDEYEYEYEYYELPSDDNYSDANQYEDYEEFTEGNKRIVKKIITKRRKKKNADNYQDDSSIIWIIVVVAAGVLFVGGSTVFIILFRKKKKKKVD